MWRCERLAAVVFGWFWLGIVAAGAARGADWVTWDPEVGGNGHNYLAVAVPEGINWHDAQVAAEAVGGHLATATSAAENTFIFSLVDSAEFWVEFPSNGWAFGPWLGGLQPPGSPEPDGGWLWVTGEAFSYTNWHAGQPNNDPSETQDRTHMANSGYPNRHATWNDLDGTNRLLRSYVVESPGPSLPAPDFDSGWRRCRPSDGWETAVTIRHDLDTHLEQLTIKTLFRRKSFGFGQYGYDVGILTEPRSVLMRGRDAIALLPGCDHTMIHYRVQIWTHGQGEGWSPSHLPSRGQ